MRTLLLISLLVCTRLHALGQSILTADGLSSYVTTTASGGGGGAIPSGALGIWNMDDGSGTVAADASGNGKTGYLTSAMTWTTGRVGGALQFDQSHFVTVTNGAFFNVGTGDFSVCFFYKTPLPTATECPISKDNGSGNGWLAYVHSSGEVTVFVATGLPGTVGYLTANTWAHIAFTRTAGTVKLYFNGAETYSWTASGSVDLGGSEPIRIGIEDGADWPAYGTIDQVLFYNVALNATQIATLSAQ